MDNQKICSKCLNDTTIKGITFDKNGTCSVCNHFEKWKDKLTDFENLEKMWLTRVENAKNCKTKGKYDALIGISGGKDSTFVLYQLIKKYNLKVLAFTIDNGFLNQWARNRIDEIVKFLGIDHQYISFDKKILSSFYQFSVKMTSAPCTACSYFVYSSTIKLAIKHKIPMAVHGRSTYQMLRFFSPNSKDSFLPFVYSSLKDYNEQELKNTYNKIIDQIRKNFPTKFYEQLSSFMPNFEKEKPVEFLPYFIYHDYDENKIVDFLEKHSVWKKPKTFNVLTHFDCDAHDASGFLYEIAEKRPHILPEISTMIRLGKITKPEAIKRLSSEKFKQIPEKSLEALSKMTNITVEELINNAKLLAKKEK
jgi:hypothetical protein